MRARIVNNLKDKGTERAHLFDVVQTRRPDNNRVAVFAAHQAVVRKPAEGDLRHRQIVALSGRADRRDGLEIVVVPVPEGVAYR